MGWKKKRLVKPDNERARCRLEGERLRVRVGSTCSSLEKEDRNKTEQTV